MPWLPHPCPGPTGELHCHSNSLTRGPWGSHQLLVASAGANAHMPSFLLLRKEFGCHQGQGRVIPIFSVPFRVQVTFSGLLISLPTHFLILISTQFTYIFRLHIYSEAQQKHHFLEETSTNDPSSLWKKFSLPLKCHNTSSTLLLWYCLLPTGSWSPVSKNKTLYYYLHAICHIGYYLI